MKRVEGTVKTPTCYWRDIGKKEKESKNPFRENVETFLWRSREILLNELTIQIILVICSVAFFGWCYETALYWMIFVLYALVILKGALIVLFLSLVGFEEFDNRKFVKSSLFITTMLMGIFSILNGQILEPSHIYLFAFSAVIF